METEAARQGQELSPAGQKIYWARLISLLVAALAIVVFGYALANVSMRLQRHITFASQWRRDLHAMDVAYAALSSAAAAQDELAYGLLRHIAWDNTLSLEDDSLQMRSDGNTRRLEFVTNARNCLPDTLAAFNAQTPAARAACRQLLTTAQ